MDDHQATGSSGQWTTQPSDTEKHKQTSITHKCEKAVCPVLTGVWI